VLVHLGLRFSDLRTAGTMAGIEAFLSLSTLGNIVRFSSHVPLLP
jgi:hypothetical protein